MLRSAKSLIGFQLSHSGGQAGYLKDIYFDDQTWAIRYFVVATSDRRVCRQVLVAPEKFVGVNEATQTLLVSLSREEIESCPPSNSARPVCKQYELQSGASGWAGPRSANSGTRADPHLRSMGAILGYQLQSHRQEIGQLQDLLVDANSWNIPYLVAAAAEGSRNPAFLVISKTVESISWIGSSISVDTSKDPQLETLQELVAVGA